MKPINKLLIANRGEIAARIAQTARKMGINVIAVFSEQDRSTLHTIGPDESWSLGEGSLHETYLNIDKIISIAKQSQADAIHPGYGFLSENPDFAKACRDNGLIFIGPSEEAIKIMGNKTEAADFVAWLNIPLPYIKKGNPRELAQMVTEEDLPVMIKAAAGGGGKGIRIVREKDRLEEALKATAREANSYFGNDTVYVEKFFENSKHIEIQILGDHQGNYIHLFERECSVQRRHQKLIEEAPSPALDDDTRQKMAKAAVQIARSLGYTNAGTVEFLVDEEKNFYFLEMNSRIQVEHPVTELITGTDLISEQIRIAEAKPLQWNQEDLRINGHAIEVRVYAEDPENDFLPVPGRIHKFNLPEMKGIRTDTGVSKGNEISLEYDPLLAKIIAWNNTREETIELLRKNLDQTVIMGIRHNLNYLNTILSSPEFRDNRFTTAFIKKNHEKIIGKIKKQKAQIDVRLLTAAYTFLQNINMKKNHREPVWSQLGYWRHYMEWSVWIENQEYHFSFTRNNYTLTINPETDGFRAELLEMKDDHLILKTKNSQSRIYFSRINDIQTELVIYGYPFQMFDKDFRTITDNKTHNDKENKNGEVIKSPMFGRILDIQVEENMTVKKGQSLAIVEAMKMENNILAPYDTKIKHITIKKGEQVKDGQIIMETYSI